MASNAELEDWNRRVQRLAQDYAPKYRPVLFPVAYHVNADTGRSWPRVETIIKESARYTPRRKPLSRATVFRLLAEMERAGAIKTEARFSEHTGRQRSSYRYLVTSVAVNRGGYSIPHDFDAPLPAEGSQTEGSQELVTGRLQLNETPRETPRETPNETPLTSFGLSEELSLELSTGELGMCGEDQPEKLTRPPGAEDSQTQDEEVSPWFTWYVWRAKSGSLACFNTMDNEFDSRFVPGHAVEICLSPEDGMWVWEIISAWGGHTGTVKQRADLLARNFATDEQLSALRIDRERGSYEHIADQAAQERAEREAEAERERAKRDAEEARERRLAAHRAALQEKDRIHEAYADRFHSGSLRAAHSAAYAATDGRPGSVIEFMRRALAA